MRLTKRDRRREAELAELVASAFPGMTVEVGHGSRWKRMCVMFRWAGFANLLPEERFHRLVSVIPQDPALEAADREGRPLSTLPPDSPVRLAVLDIAQKVGLI